VTGTFGIIANFSIFGLFFTTPAVSSQSPCATRLQSSGSQTFIVDDPQNKMKFDLVTYLKIKYYYNTGFGDPTMGRDPPVEKHCFRAVFLNRRDASRYQELEAFFPGLELFWKPYNIH